MDKPLTHKASWQLPVAILIALCLWTFMFSPLTSSLVNFWVMMTCSACTLSILATWWGRSWWKGMEVRPLIDVPLGITIAAALWDIFWLGDSVSQLLFSFARPEVNLIYAMKDGESPVILSILLLVLIGPAEEIFWRGYVQKSLGEKMGRFWGFIVATAIYALVHVGALNLMLVLAAGTAGAVWGLLYYLTPKHFGAIILSHALWDAAVFIWFPI